MYKFKALFIKMTLVSSYIYFCKAILMLVDKNRSHTQLLASSDPINSNWIIASQQLDWQMTVIGFGKISEKIYVIASQW